jgi:hypothetical protein
VYVSFWSWHAHGSHSVCLPRQGVTLYLKLMVSQHILWAIVMIYAHVVWSRLTSFSLGIHGQIVGVLCWPFLVIQLNSSIAVQQQFWWDPGGDQCLLTESQSINGLGNLQMHQTNHLLSRRKGGWFYYSFSLVVSTSYLKKLWCSWKEIVMVYTSLLLASTCKSSRVTMDAEAIQISSWQFNKIQLSFCWGSASSPKVL